MSSFLDSLKSAHKKRGGHKLLYGKPGDGKTSLWCQIPKSGMISALSDRGADDLISSGAIAADYPVFVVSNWTNLRAALQEWAANPPFKSLNLDNFTEFQTYARRHITDTQYNGDDNEFNKFGRQGWGLVASEWERFLDDIDLCRDAGVEVNSIAHAKATRMEDPMLGTYDAWMPDLFDGDKKGAPSILTPTINRASEVLFLYREVFVEKGKAKGSENGRTRLLQTQNTASAVAKSRAGLPSPICLGDSGPAVAFTNLRDAYVKAKEANKTNG